MQSREVDRFAAQIRALKDRAGISFEELAKRTGVSSSSLHRYCSGTKIPTGYGAVHTLAKACGASNEELRELHRLWALADATRSLAAAPGEMPTTIPSNDRRRRITIATVTTACLTAVAASLIAAVSADRPDTSVVAENPPEATGTTTPVRVFNVEERCRQRSDRAPGCSIGLAVDPRRNYDAHNVVHHRVWHEDALNADCVVFDGDEVVDEIGTKSTRWFRVRLDDVPRGHAWLSGIRTRDTPALPKCAP
ncbi:MAG: helix-turn-helix domain-containing protein [Stackebrandtia sp.]